MHSGITFMGKHSFKDLGITMAHKREIGIPNKKKIKQTVPFSNQTYDYSELFGSQVYEERPIKYTFNIANREIKTKAQMNMVKTEMINWLMTSGGKQKLYDDHYEDYYFLAEIEGSSSFQENWYYGFLEVEFTAYPFMIKERKEGNDIWDTFNFLLDVSQLTTFNIVGSKRVSLINNGAPNVTPKIIANSSFTIIHDGKEFNIKSGTSEDLDFVLRTGDNSMSIRGNGRIEFIFHQELI